MPVFIYPPREKKGEKSVGSGCPEKREKSKKKRAVFFPGNREGKEGKERSVGHHLLLGEGGGGKVLKKKRGSLLHCSSCKGEEKGGEGVVSSSSARRGEKN